MSVQIRKLGPVLSIACITIGTLFLGSCYWNPQGGVGKVTLSLQSTGRAQLPPASPSVSYARVYLYSDDLNSNINVGDGKAYAEAPISSGSGTINVENVPAGSGYRLLLALGNKPDGSTFVPSSFGYSASFDVTAGHQTNVSVASVADVGLLTIGQSSPLLYDSGLLGKNVTGVTFEPTSGLFGATTQSALYRGTSASPLSAANGVLPPGQTANSVSQGNGQFLVNTNAGIVTFGTTGAYIPSSVFTQSGAPTGSVQQSAYNSATDTYYYRTVSGGLGGITGASSSGQWFTVNLSNGTSNEVTLDLATNNSDSNLFVSTTTGAYAVGTTLLSTGNNNLNFLTTYGAKLTVTDASVKRFIASMAVCDSVSSHFYVGTSSGVYSLTVTSVDSSVGAVGQVPGSTVDLVSDLGAQLWPSTSGHPFAKVVVPPSGGYPVAVAISNDLLVIYDGYGSAQVLPLAAVTLGKLNAVAIDTGSAPTVAIAGTEGLTYFTIQSGG